MIYDYLIVGAGLFGCTFANLANKIGKKCLIIDKRSHAFGNCYTENINDINIHKYGPHIFHTSNDNIWNYVNKFAKFNNFVNRPKVIFNNKIYSFPINLFTLYQLWGLSNPAEAKLKLEEVKIKIDNPKNLEEWILSQVGEEIYHTFIHGYTKKQWNTDPKNLPSSIIKRLPIRLNFDDNYFNDTYQGIPIGGYSQMMSNMIEGIPIRLNIDYLENRDFWNSQARVIVYCGPIDSFFDKIYGSLEYRSLRFENDWYKTDDFQGNAVINYTNADIPFTRTVEHKHFDKSDSSCTIVTREFPANYQDTKEAYYPITDQKNTDLYQKYKNLTNNLNKFIFGGRLAQYKYYDMHQVIGSAFKKFEEINS
jgi:UDP-galactopyranose mutase